MRTATIRLLVLWLAAGIASEAAPVAGTARLTAFLRDHVATGETADCIGTAAIRDVRVLDDRHIVFRLAHDRYALNVLPHTCPRLAVERRFAYAPTGARLCQIDTITVFDDIGFDHTPVAAAASPRMRLPLNGPRCGLGRFELYTNATDGDR